MPLIVVTGRPCTGKTTIATRVKEFFEAQEVFEDVILINEESLALSKTLSYSTSNHEKDLRGALKSAMEHALIRPNRVVILDALNYIKGYRYEIYCTARTARTPHCVLWVGSTEQEGKERNELRRAAGMNTYDDNILDDLWKRFEAPNDANRWDKPLFMVKNTSTGKEVDSSSIPLSEPSNQPSAAAPKVVKSSWKPKKKNSEVSPKLSTDSRGTETLPSNEVPELPSMLSISGSAVSYADDLNTFSDLMDVLTPMKEYLLTTNLPLPNSSTVSAQHGQAHLLYELDRTSQKITQAIMAHQAEALEGTPLKFSEFDRALTLNRHISLAELQRYRSQFVKVNSQHPPHSSVAVGVSFIEFLAVHL